MSAAGLYRTTGSAAGLPGPSGIDGALFEALKLALHPDGGPFRAAARRFHVELVLAAAEFTRLRLVLRHEAGDGGCGSVPIVRTGNGGDEFGMARVGGVEALLEDFDLSRDAEPLWQEVVVAEDFVPEPIVAGQKARRLIEVKRLAFARQVRKHAARDGILDLGFDELFVAHS